MKTSWFFHPNLPQARTVRTAQLEGYSGSGIFAGKGRGEAV
jgi:hypothetical protein